MRILLLPGYGPLITALRHALHDIAQVVMLTHELFLDVLYITAVSQCESNGCYAVPAVSDNEQFDMVIGEDAISSPCPYRMLLYSRRNVVDGCCVADSASAPPILCCCRPGSTEQERCVLIAAAVRHSVVMGTAVPRCISAVPLPTEAQQQELEIIHELFSSEDELCINHDVITARTRPRLQIQQSNRPCGAHIVWSEPSRSLHIQATIEFVLSPQVSMSRAAVIL